MWLVAILDLSGQSRFGPLCGRVGRGPRCSEFGWDYVEECLVFSKSGGAVLQCAHRLSSFHLCPNLTVTKPCLHSPVSAPAFWVPVSRHPCPSPDTGHVLSCIASFYPVGQCVPLDCKTVVPSGQWKVLLQHREKNQPRLKQSRETMGQDSSRTHLDLLCTLAPPHSPSSLLPF